MATNNEMVNAPIDVNAVFDALEAWINQRPGLDPANYGLAPEQARWDGPKTRLDNQRAFRAELRSIGNDKKRALKALDEARGLTPANPELLAEAFKRAFSGRLGWKGYPQCKYCGYRPDVDRGTPCDTAVDHAYEFIGHLEYTTGQYWPTEYRKAAASVLETYIASWKQAYAAEHPQTFTYRTMEDVEAANRAVGGHWFDRDTMRYFKTRIESGAVGCDYGPDGQPRRARFITSEKGPDEVRRYTVREAQPDGSIDTIGEFQQYRTREAARAAILKNPEVGR